MSFIAQCMRALRPLSRTGINFWRRRTTRRYPRTQTKARLQPDLVYDDQGREHCLACHLCVAACPTDCLYIEAELALDQQREKQPRMAEIDLGRCLNCGLCAASCPQDAIELVPRAGIGSPLKRNMVRDRTTIA